MYDNSKHWMEGVEPWQIHEGWVEDNWSGALTKQVLTRLKAATCFSGIAFEQVLRKHSGVMRFWALGIHYRRVFVDFIDFDRQSGLVMLVFNQSQLITGSDTYEPTYFQFPYESIDLLAFGVGIWLSCRDAALHGRDWYLEPIVKEFKDLQCRTDIFGAGFPGRDFDEWMGNFFFSVMGYAPGAVKPPYRLMVYGGTAS